MGKKRGFRRLLLSYLPVFFVISLTLLLLAYLALSEMSQRSASKANTLLSHNISQTIDDALRGLDELMSSELRDNEAIKAFFAPVPAADRQRTDYEAAAALNETMRKHPLLHSIYLYRTPDATVLTPSSLIPLDRFGDKQFIGANVSALTPLRWETKRIYKERPDSAGAPVVSLVKIAHLAERSLIVYQVGTDRLSELIAKMSESKLNFVELVDDDGKLIASKRLAGSGSDAGDAPDSGKQLSFVRSDYTGWSVRSGIYDSSVLDWVSSLFYVWISFGFAVIALGAVWLSYVTRRHFKPIESVAGRIEAFARQKSEQLRIDEKSDEVNYIEAAIEQLLDQHSLMQMRHEENIVYRKRHVFLNMLEDEEFAERASQAELSLLGIEPPVAEALVALIEIDQSYEFAGKYSRRDRHLLKQVIGNVAGEIAGNAPVRQCSEWVGPHQMGIVFAADDPGVAERAAVETLEKLRAWIEQNLSFTVTASVGGRCLSTAGLPGSYRRAQQLLGYKTSLGTNRLIVPADISQPHDEMFKRLQDVRLLCQSFRSGDPDWAERLNELYRSVRAALLTREDLFRLFHMLTVHLHREMMELPGEFQAIWYTGFGRRLERIAERHETLDDTFAALDGLLQEAFGRMRELREAKTAHQTLQNVKAYIEERYGDPDLSLAQVSEEFGYNASYFSRAFKETFGVKLIDYVTRIRVDKAAELLRETSVSIQEIAERVGYTNALSFIRAFKKLTGTTPGHYRKERPDEPERTNQQKR
ncbi:AraC family transcriptional regulator [Paenibacillus sp. GYB003]|uniref:AraC family transcriptional regulator n=1 Tax=Paenibacillus sp. GYB003 TaxID=2994392 RepID=UPI002F96B933